MTEGIRGSKLTWDKNRGGAVSGIFVTIEGGEGAGKSLFVQGLTRVLEQRGKTYLLTREPGGTPLADQIRRMFLEPPEGDSPTALTELLMVSAARAQHVHKKIKPALEQDLWVLCDRFYDSTRVYQGILGGIPTETLEAIVEMSVENCHPQLSFLLDCSAEISMARVRQRTQNAGQNMAQANRYDGGNAAMHDKLRQGYLEVAQRFPHRIHVINAAQSPEQVLQEAVQILMQSGYL
jgi:dTMP kinase